LNFSIKKVYCKCKFYFLSFYIMKKIILSFIKMVSFIILSISIVLFIMTFFNQSYFLLLWEEYLKWELKDRIELLDDKIDFNISEETKVWKVLDNFWLTKKIDETKEKIKEKSLVKTNEIVNKAFNWGINQMKDITFFWKSLKEEIKSIINNFILDIRIFLITNFIWFLMIYMLMFYKSRKDIIKNMFYIIIVLFLVMIWGLFYYILWQNWVTNIVKNDFLWYSYPIIILVFMWFFIYFFNKPNNVWILNNYETWKFVLNSKWIKGAKSDEIIEWWLTIIWFIITIIELVLSIIFIPFSLE